MWEISEEMGILFDPILVLTLSYYSYIGFLLRSSPARCQGKAVKGRSARQRMAGKGTVTNIAISEGRASQFFGGGAASVQCA